MASSKEYVNYVLEQLSDLDEVSHRAMMGEYVIYADGKVVGGIYDDRFLLKPLNTAVELMREAGREVRMELPYPGAKEMLVADIDDSELTCRMVQAISSELSAPRKKRESGKAVKNRK